MYKMFLITQIHSKLQISNILRFRGEKRRGLGPRNDVPTTCKEAGSGPAEKIRNA